MSSRPKFIFITLFFFLIASFVFSQTFTSSNLPLVVINTNGRAIVDESKTIVDFGIIWNGAGMRNSLTDLKNNFNGKVGIEIRGSSSQMFPKKSYGFETKSAAGLDVDVSLLGLPEENDWILYAPYTDKTMIRDVLTYTLDAALGHWSPRCRYVELFLNNQYQGVYVLMEKIKRNKNRVDIAKLLTTDNSGEDLTGGYILKIDKTTGESGSDGWYSSYYNATGKTFYQYDYPKAKEITSTQKTYIRTWVQNMENALYSGKYAGTGNYHEYLNDSSFIDFMIINEMAKNVDGYRLSSFLYKGKNDRINCGPIWDFNLTYGNADYYNGWIATGFQYQANLGTDGWQNPFWWNRLMADPEYVKKLKIRWTSLRKKELSNQRVTFVIDSLTSLISEAKDRNYQKWTQVIGYHVWPNYYVGRSYSDEVNWMKNWISQRLVWLDQQWPYTVTGSDELLTAQSHSIYPNPFVNRLTVQLASAQSGEVVAELYNSGGILVSKSKATIQNGEIQLNFSGSKLLTGLYTIRLTRNNRVLLTEKIVKTL
ncbi:MAG: CotH kinase family protein [Prolixibacteraceae bacterium]|nr:CotH kinase family protein [Prolixibacteraceae bacterium]